jgi:arabinofuranosyltransferase
MSAAARAILVGFLVLGLCYLMTMCAWQSDDAYITFRTVRNLWQGHGLTWNPGERVQAFTHPLWMMVCAICYGVSHEVYYSTLVVSILLALSAAVLLIRPVWTVSALAAAALLLLATSGAFIDYSTSGLENSLLFILLVVFVRLTQHESSRRLLLMSLLASAVGLTRPDALLIVLPATLGDWWLSGHSRAALRPLLLGFLPLVAWEVFALIYYGSLVPNSALAKLNIEVPLTTLIHHGWLYLGDSLTRDPITLTTIVAGLVFAFRPAAKRQRLVLAGVALYGGFLLRVGGDFMSGRFLAAPFVAVLAVCAQVAAASPRRQEFARPASVLSLILVVFGFSWPGTRWTSGPEYGADLVVAQIVRPSGIADERAYYYPSTGLVRLLLYRSTADRPGQPFPPFGGAIEGARYAASRAPVTVWGAAGFFGYFAGDKKVIDRWALADPLLARIPFRPKGEWRIGHYPRELPAGYLESCAKQQNLLREPGLAALYDGLTEVTRGPLFAPGRWREIWRLHTGYYKPILEKAARESPTGILENERGPRRSC